MGLRAAAFPHDRSGLGQRRRRAASGTDGQMRVHVVRNQQFEQSRSAAGHRTVSWTRQTPIPEKEKIHITYCFRYIFLVRMPFQEPRTTSLSANTTPRRRMPLHAPQERERDRVLGFGSRWKLTDEQRPARLPYGRRSRGLPLRSGAAAAPWKRCANSRRAATSATHRYQAGWRSFSVVVLLARLDALALPAS